VYPGEEIIKAHDVLNDSRFQDVRQVENEEIIKGSDLLNNSRF